MLRSVALLCLILSVGAFSAAQTGGAPGNGAGFDLSNTCVYSGPKLKHFIQHDVPGKLSASSLAAALALCSTTEGCGGVTEQYSRFELRVGPGATVDTLYNTTSWVLTRSCRDPYCESKTQHDALVCLYTKLAGSDWRKVLGYTGSDYCSWTDQYDPLLGDGVRCDSSRNVTAIVENNRVDIWGGGEMLSVFQSLRLLPKLKTINMTHSGISGTVPWALVASLPHLSQIDFTGNAISGSLSNSVDFGPARMDGLLLALPSNNISGTIPNSFATLMRSVSKLRLGSNCISGTLPSLHDMQALTLLSLNSAGSALYCGSGTTLSKISGTLPKSIGAPLRSMSMTNQALSGTLPEMPHFFAAPIEHVHLSGNAISGTFPNSWTYSELTRGIMKLSLNHNKLSGTLAPGMSSWTSLSALILNDNHFTGSISRAAGAVSPVILVLNFGNNNFTSIDADVCSAWRRLNKCNIRNNSFDCCLACLGQWGSPCWGQCQGEQCSAPLVPTSKPTSSSDALHKKWWLVLLTFITAAAFATLASLLALGAYVWWKRRAKRRLRNEMGGRVALRGIIEGGSLETALLADHDDAAAAAAAVAFEKEADSYAAWCSPAVAQQRLTVVEELKSRRAAYDTSSMVRIGLLNSRSITDTKPTVFYDQRRVGLLGRGRFGTVCLGAVHWPRQQSIGVCGSSESRGGHELVAVKTTMVTEGSVGSVMERNAAAEVGSPRIITTNEGNLLWAAHGHPNIVGLIGVVDGGVVAEHLVLELCPVSLSERALSLHAPELRRLIGIDIRLQCHLSAGLLHGLSHLHSLRICHRDVKPSNALIHVGPPTRANGMTGLTIKLGDFGLAKIGASDETMHRGASEFDVSMTLTPFCGTVGWRAPEQYRTDSLSCQPHTTSVVSTTIEEQQLSDAYAAGMVIFYFFFGTKRRMHAPLMVDHTASSSGSSSSSSSSAEGANSSVAGAEVVAGVAATSDGDVLRQHQRGQRLHVDQMFQLFHGRCDRLQSREVNDLVHTMLASRKDAVASHFAAARGSTLPPTVARELAVWSAVVDGLTNRTPAMRMAIFDAAKLVDCYDSEDGGVQYRNGDAAAAYNDAEVHTLFLCIGDVHPSSRSLAYICAAHYSAQHSRVVEVSELEHPPDEGDLAAKLTSLFVMRFAGLRTLHVVRSSVDEATRAATDSALREALDSMAVPIALLISVGERGCGSAAARAMLHSAEAVVGWEGARENGGESDVSLLFSSAMHDELAKEGGQYDPEQAVETARITVKSVSEFRGLYDGQTAAFEIKYAMVSPNASCVDVATGRVDATAGRGTTPGALPVGEPFYLTMQTRGKGWERVE